MVSVFQYISECWHDIVVCIKVNFGDRSAVQVSISRFKTSVPVIWLIVKTYTCCTRGVMSYISFKILIILSTNIFIMLIPLSWIYWLPYLKCVSFSLMCSFNRLTYISFKFFSSHCNSKVPKRYICTSWCVFWMDIRREELSLILGSLILKLADLTSRLFLFTFSKRSTAGNL